MGNYSYVKTAQGDVIGLWLLNSKDAQDPDMVAMIMVKDGIPLSNLDDGYRTVPNTYDNKGGCFFMFGLYPAPGEHDVPVKDSRPTVTREGKKYPILSSSKEINSIIANDGRYAFKTTFGKLPNDLEKVITEQKGKSVDLTAQILVLCPNCQINVTSELLAQWVLHESKKLQSRYGFGSFVVMLKGKDSPLSLLSDGKCPSCMEKECYYLFDPGGF